MGKRSDFERRPRDFYPTPIEAVRPLLPHLIGGKFIEPCAGDGALIRAILDLAPDEEAVDAYDIAPKWIGVRCADALTERPPQPIDYFITNPPWDRAILHPLIEHLTSIAPAWLLFDADWAHTRQAAPFLKTCAATVSVGRVKWIPESKMTGKDNCAWYLFYRGAEQTIFYPRA